MAKRRVGAEQYYTDPVLARRCVEEVDTLFPLESFTRIVEPSAGNGAFYCLLPQKTRIGIDLHPAYAGLIQTDFLTWKPSPITDHSNAGSARSLTIGNPPFGQRGALAMAFIEHAATFSDVIALIVPRSFKKYTFINRMPQHFHLCHQFDCQQFLSPQGSPVQVKTAFQVWQRRCTPRAKIHLPETHPDFSLHHCHLSRITPSKLALLVASHPFALPQVGARFTPRPSHEIIKGSYWFVQPHVDQVQQRFTRLDFSFLHGMNTAHTSLSKRDIIAAYQAVLDSESPATNTGGQQ